MSSILDLVDILVVSGGLPPGDALRLSREIDAAFGLSTKHGGSTEAQRARWRVKAARKRARQKEKVPGGPETEGILSNQTNTLSVEGKKKPDARPPGDVPPAINDGWPPDHLEQFWKNFPPFRREAKRKVGEKLARLRKDGIVAWPTLLNAVMKFAATNPGQYAPAPMVWLNGEKWDREYGTTGGSNGEAQIAIDPNKLGFAGQAALRRHRIAQGPERPSPEDLQPVNRR